MFRRRPGAEADATVAGVRMTERRSYGEAKVRVTFIVEPADGVEQIAWNDSGQANWWATAHAGPGKPRGIRRQPGPALL